jgi:hypothetical protein
VLLLSLLEIGMRLDAASFFRFDVGKNRDGVRASAVGNVTLGGEVASAIRAAVSQQGDEVFVTGGAADDGEGLGPVCFTVWVLLLLVRGFTCRFMVWSPVWVAC